ncbi:MAG: response regulator [Bacteroidetes bacterium]|nr:response regulator [Bacteroidota bacterium]
MEQHVLRILIIDDETAFSNLLKMDLETSDAYKVTTEESGEAGIEKLKDENFDIILLDYHLGSMTGLQVLEWMNSEKKETPVIMLTAAGTEEVAVNAMKLGAYDYARKERLELEHLPVLINGVYERYLFRLDTKKRELEKIEKEKQQAAMQMFQTTVRTIAHHVNNALAVIMLRSASYERNARKNLDPTTADQLINLIEDLKEQATVIESVVRSLVELSNVVYTHYASDQSIIDIKKDLEENLKKLLEHPEAFAEQ